MYIKLASIFVIFVIFMKYIVIIIATLLCLLFIIEFMLFSYLYSETKNNINKSLKN
jgi:hypothetical protein